MKAEKKEIRIVKAFLDLLESKDKSEKLIHDMKTNLHDTFSEVGNLYDDLKTEKLNV
jgi:hypothetical protein